ncbi:MAG TPA: enoyl-CoA hydratase/isomerase family protein [Acidimicrobiia bacterium]|nr:enoyl-CoA hydratase/isomerase family protein [Acidimicrobiia bacterium]
MTAFALTYDGPVAVATMRNGENRIGSDMLGSWNSMLDDVIDDDSVSSLVVVGSDRYWSTGLDLEEVAELTEVERMSFMRRVDLLLGRILELPLVTIAALNGHTYAAGALLALAHDFRIMRHDKGYFCLPSIDVGIPFSPGMSALITAKLPQPIAHDLVVSCRRIGGAEAERTGVINRATDAASVLPVAVGLGHEYSGKDAATIRAVKRRLYPEATSMLSVDE